MRYTECRLTPIAELLLAEIDRDTVDFVPNYDGSFREPKLLPARLPMLLLNGASGIGVGMATDIPSHNLREVAKAVVATIRNPAITLDELLQHVPGPGLARRRADHLGARGDPRGLRDRPRIAARARALDGREARARPVAGGGDRAAAGVSARAVLEDIEAPPIPSPGTARSRCRRSR